MNISKPIRLSVHAEQRSKLRGASFEEIIETVKTGEWHNSELGKLESRKDFVFETIWNNKFYHTKQVRPIFIEEETEIIIITVYVYYF